MAMNATMSTVLVAGRRRDQASGAIIKDASENLDGSRNQGDGVPELALLGSTLVVHRSRWRVQQGVNLRPDGNPVGSFSMLGFGASSR